METRFAAVQTHVLVVIPVEDTETRRQLRSMYGERNRLVVFADNLVQGLHSIRSDTGAVLVFKSSLENQEVYYRGFIAAMLRERHTPVLFVTGYTPNSLEGSLIEAL